MQKETIFADGFIFKKPREGAPSFVKGSLSIKSQDAIKFINEHTKADGWINLDLKMSTQGKLYLALNDFKPTQNNKIELQKPSEWDFNEGQM